MHFDLFECYCVEMCVSPSSACLSHVPSSYTSRGPCRWTMHRAPWGLSSGAERTWRQHHSSQTPGQSFSLFHGHSPPLHTLPLPHSLPLSSLPSFLPHRSTEHHLNLQACPGHPLSSFRYRKPGPEMGNLVSSTRGEKRAGGLMKPFPSTSDDTMRQAGWGWS